MHKYSLFALLIALTANGAHATDRIVGATSLYATIGDALLVSSDGDRILVEPGLYPEDLLIGKSVSILPNQAGTQPFLSGNIRLANADGKHVLILGIKLAGHIVKEGTFTQRTELDIVGSRIDGLIIAVDPYIHVRLLRDTLACQISLSSGTLIGNEIPGCVGGAAGVLFQGTSALPDEIRVIGNSLGAYVPWLGVSIVSDTRFFIENNYIRAANGYPAITVQRNTVLYSGISRVLNNTLVRATNASGTAIELTINQGAGFVARNNAIIGYTGGLGPFGSSHYSNVVTVAAAIDPSTGGPSIGSPLIDAGDPDPRYLDLDLTTNDVGCYGGSNSRANFTGPMGSAVVGFMQAPRVVAQGETVNISATGFDR